MFIRRGTIDSESIAFQNQQNGVVARLLDGENRIDRWFIRWGDLLSPIVVKETRQMLRSRQFIWTFGFLLLCILGWTLLSIASLMPGIYYYPSGVSLLGGYLVMLALPALIIIPIAAFFSMSSELNSNTFEVLSISPLSSHKIVLGKVVVAGVQLLLHISALAPCIALTYLLRGVSIISLVMIFPCIITVSFVLISGSVMMATFCRTVAQTVLILILNLIVTVIVFYWTIGILFDAMLSGREMFDDWASVAEYGAPILAIIAGYGVLALMVGGASIGIAGENYSRSIRVWLATQSLAIFWCAMWFSRNESIVHYEFVAATLFLLTLHWCAAGVYIVSEPGQISVRAQRSLPSTLMSRMLGTLLVPGGGMGYFFILCNYAAYVIMFIVLTILTGQTENQITLTVTCLAYMAFYFGIFRLVMYFIPVASSNRALPPLLFLLLLSMGTGGPYFLSAYLNNFNNPVYDIYCFTNPFWTLAEFSSFSNVRGAVLVLFFASFLIVCINAAMASGDVTLVRVRSPEEMEKESKARRESASESPFDAE